MHGKGIMHFVFCFLRMINSKKKMYLIIVIMSNYHFFFKIKTTGFNMSNDKADLRDIDYKKDFFFSWQICYDRYLRF